MFNSFKGDLLLDSFVIIIIAETSYLVGRTSLRLHEFQPALDNSRHFLVGFGKEIFFFVFF
jgi:hypothetical protein